MGLIRLAFIILVSATGLSSCSESKVYPGAPIPLIEAQHDSTISSPAGNLISTAIREMNNLDVVFYPRSFIKANRVAVLDPDNHGEDQIEKILDLYAPIPQDRFLVGRMSGEDIVKFLKSRSSEFYGIEIEVAGLQYNIHYVGGIPQYAYFSDHRGEEFDLDKVYRVALSSWFYFSGATFPGYKYGSGLNFAFNPEDRIVSGRKSLSEYLRSRKALPNLSKPRAKVTTFTRKHLGSKKISEIQGARHRSPYFGHKVITTGVVTAIGLSDWYPGGMDLYIQSLIPDQLDETSEGLHVHLEEEILSGMEKIQLGDRLLFEGVVYEQMSRQGLGRTSLREIDNWKRLSSGHKIKPIILGINGDRRIPDKRISTYRGDLNLKAWLNLNDGIDFWESLEGMKIQINDPQVVGFRGGQEELENTKPKSYLNLYVVADALERKTQITPAGGIIVDMVNDDLNPEILPIISNHLSYNLNTAAVFNVGDIIEGKVEGVLGYERNIFQEGEYALVLPESQDAIDSLIKKNGETIISPKNRHVSQLESTQDHLTVATFNLENLAGNQKERLYIFARAIVDNLRCPDILNLVEIQDNNGLDFLNGSEADLTLKRLIGLIHCRGSDYKFVNIDPVQHAEGGQPGGNIRIAYLYNANRVKFIERNKGSALDETRVDKNGNLTHNPGRVFPNSSTFARSRRSLVAQFSFKGEKVFVIGNHFNSKLGDTSYWSHVQPPAIFSDSRRSRMADEIHDFVAHIERRSPRALIAVMGDFNAIFSENSMKILEGDRLNNLLKLLPPNMRYTTNYNGNSQALDYILVNGAFMARDPEVQILNINSDFMGRLSDHDPVVARFRFR